MPSPIGHTMAGLIIGLCKAVCPTSVVKELLFCIVLSNLPDLDFIPGILVGDLNRFHHRFSHSILFVLIISLFIGFIWRKDRGLLAFILLTNHLLLDYFTKDTSFPYGMTLFWPFSDRYYISLSAIFPAYKKRAMVMDIINPANLLGYLIEVGIFLPFLIFALYIYRRRK